MINHNEQTGNPNHKMYLVEYYNYRDSPINGYRITKDVILTGHDIDQIKTIFFEEVDNCGIIKICEITCLEDYGNQYLKSDGTKGNQLDGDELLF